jgi:hypothetical protein
MDWFATESAEGLDHLTPPPLTPLGQSTVHRPLCILHPPLSWCTPKICHTRTPCFGLSDFPQFLQPRCVQECVETICLYMHEPPIGIACLSRFIIVFGWFKPVFHIKFRFDPVVVVLQWLLCIATHLPIQIPSKMRRMRMPGQKWLRRSLRLTKMSGKALGLQRKRTPKSFSTASLRA